MTSAPARPDDSVIAEHSLLRACSAEETLSRVAALHEQCGITRVANLTGLDCVGIPVVAVYRPNARSIAVSQGKGQTLAAARASGVMEAIEVGHAEQCDVPLRRASATELQRSRRLCTVDALPRQAGAPTFDSDLPRLWAEGTDLSDGAERWCPLETIDADYTRQDVEPGCLRSTNGLASGNTWSEAVAHGLCELIERDAVAVWRSRARRTGVVEGRVAPDSIDDPACRRLLSQFANADIDVGIWNVTSDVGIPTFFVLIMDRHAGENLSVARPANGKGCHPSRAIALSRALTEAAQSRLTYISGARDDLSESDYDLSQQRVNVRESRSFLNDDSQHAGHDFGDCIDHGLSEADRRMDDILGALHRVGMTEVLAVDLSVNTPQLSVARVIVPGLEGPDEHAAWVPGVRARNA